MVDLMYYKIIANGRIEVLLQVDHWVEKQTMHLVKSTAKGTQSIQSNGRPSTLKILWTFNY